MTEPWMPRQRDQVLRLGPLGLASEVAGQDGEDLIDVGLLVLVRFAICVCTVTSSDQLRMCVAG